MPWRCFWLEPTGDAEFGLRRYARVGKDNSNYTCAGGWHTALAWLGERLPYPRDEEKRSYPLAESVLKVRRNDRRWPKECDSCDYRFTSADAKQVWAEELYRRSDNRRLRVWHPSIHPPGVPTAEPGAMRDAWWYSNFTSMLNPNRPKDGIILSVLCPFMTGEPGGWDWSPDMQASSGGYWARVGDPRNPPLLTVNPSIAIGPPKDPRYYHGFLRNGVLTDHVG